MEAEVRLVSPQAWDDALACYRMQSGRGPAEGVTGVWKARMCASGYSCVALVRYRIRVSGIREATAQALVSGRRSVWRSVFREVGTVIAGRPSGFTGLPRGEAEVSLVAEMDALEVVAQSRSLLCSLTDLDTRKAWRAVVDALAGCDPEIAALCVPECVACGFCPQWDTCGRSGQPAFGRAVERYRTAVTEGRI